MYEKCGSFWVGCIIAFNLIHSYKEFKYLILNSETKLNHLKLNLYKIHGFFHYF